MDSGPDPSGRPGMTGKSVSETPAEAPQTERPRQHLGEAGAEHAGLATPIKIVGHCRARRMSKKGGADRQVAKCCGDKDFHEPRPVLGN